ncbi:MAG: hypothetical protein L0L39_06020 [Atopostipes suicloacalis]|nr:hypothetical protein [Atopostipes suicloacalis]
MNIVAFCEEITRLGFYLFFKRIENAAVILIWIKSTNDNSLIPLAHVRQDRTDYAIYYNDAWKAMDFEKQKKLIQLMKAYSIYKRTESNNR